MFEKRLKEISSYLNSKERKEYFILTHKKHKREIYFQNSKEAIEFIKIKFKSSYKKMFVYYLIRMGFLKLFLRKIKLSKNFGDVIFVANSIRGFNLKDGEVISLIRNSSEKKEFISLAKTNEKMYKNGFGPKIIEFNKRVPYLKEELLPEYKGDDDLKVFLKLFDFYKMEGFKKKSLRGYVDFLHMMLVNKGIKNRLLENLLRDLKKKKIKLIIVKPHGAFCKEQVLIKGNSYVFVDWSKEKGFKRDIITRDLVSYFRDEIDLLKNFKLKNLLKIYPKRVQKDIFYYLILNEIGSISRRGLSKFHLERIKNLLKYKNAI